MDGDDDIVPTMLVTDGAKIQEKKLTGEEMQNTGMIMLATQDGMQDKHPKKIPLL